MKALIFGANGQDGFYLCKCCSDHGIEPIGVSRTGDWIRADVSNQSQVYALFDRIRPDFAFHLAANSSTRHDVIFENHETISSGSLNVLEATRRYAPDCRVFLSGSGVQFVNSGNPIKENDDFEAKNPYSVARIQSVFASRYYRTLGIRSYVGYLFHHDSPRRSSRHVSMKIATAVSRIAAGSGEFLELGDLSVKKEWGYAGDIAEGIFHLVNQDEVLEACIGTGLAYSIEDWVEVCFELAGLDWRKHVRTIDGFKAEYPILVSDPETINLTGWTARTSFSDLAALILESCDTP